MPEPDPQPKVTRRMQNRAIGDVLRTLRRESKLTQATVAALAGINRTHLIALESGEHNPGVHRLSLVARVYKLTPAQLFERVDQRALYLWEREHKRRRKK